MDTFGWRARKIGAGVDDLAVAEARLTTNESYGADIRRIIADWCQVKIL